MANTRTSTKRARQAKRRYLQNKSIRSMTYTLLKAATEAIQSVADSTQVHHAYRNAIRALSKAASKKALPKDRVSHKISRLTVLMKKTQSAAAPLTKATHERTP